MSCDQRPLPMMFVKKNVDDAFIGNFMKKKHPALSMLIGKQETAYLCFSAADFKQLINNCAAVAGAVGLKIYFATYTFTGTTAMDDIVNAGYDKMLTLIFTPTADKDANGDCNDIGGNYFMINPLKGGVITVNPADAAKLVAAYTKTKMPLLQQIIKDAGAPAAVSETKTLWIVLSAFNDANSGFIAEMDCQGATGISAYIGSYPKGSSDPGGTGKPVDWQLGLIFCLAQASTYVGKQYFYHFDIEDIPVATARQSAPGGGDTLNPCPPATTNCSNL